MGTSVLLVALIAMGSVGASIPQRAIEKQNEVFLRLWGTEFEWKFDQLPANGTIPNYRLPYSGYIYPDKSGGTSSALRKYDMAYNRGRMAAVGYEQRDTTSFKKPTEQRAGLFGIRTRTVMETPNWHGHCNGWTAATMRHAEPQTSVRMNGVTFTPADIKALLAEIYIYNDIEHLAGVDWPMNAGLLHVILANWLGRGAHPVGVEAMPGPEKWNYPIYSYASDSVKRSARQVEVKLNIAYAKDSNGEYQQSPHIRRIRSFHYMLDLNARGEIIGGSFFRDSGAIDMLWIPMRPKQGGAKGNEPGNPYVDVDKVLAIWRASVPEEERKQWLVIDPAEPDRVAEIPEVESLVPIQFVGAARQPNQVNHAANAAATTETPPTAYPTTETPNSDLPMEAAEAASSAEASDPSEPSEAGDQAAPEQPETDMADNDDPADDSERSPDIADTLTPRLLDAMGD